MYINNHEYFREIFINCGHSEFQAESKVKDIFINKFLLIIFLAIINAILLFFIFPDFGDEEYKYYLAGIVSISVINIIIALYNSKNSKDIVKYARNCGKKMMLIMYDSEEYDESTNSITFKNPVYVDKP